MRKPCSHKDKNTNEEKYGIVNLYVTYEYLYQSTVNIQSDKK